MAQVSLEIAAMAENPSLKNNQTGKMDAHTHKHTPIQEDASSNM